MLVPTEGSKEATVGIVFKKLDHETRRLGAKPVLSFLVVGMPSTLLPS